MRSPLRTMTAVWMGVAKLKHEIDTGTIELDGDRVIAGAIQQWLGLSPFREGAAAGWPGPAGSKRT